MSKNKNTQQRVPYQSANSNLVDKTVKTSAPAEKKEVFPAADHVTKIMQAQQAALNAEAETGRLFMMLQNAANAASQANQEHQAAHTQALLSLGIDPTGKAHGHWAWDVKKLGYVKQEG
jgi:hypothetical protein